MMIKFAISLAAIASAFSSPVSAQELHAPTSSAVESGLDKARLAAAETTVDYLFPLGTYQRMMKGTMDQMMNNIIAQAFDRPMAETMQGYGIADDSLNKMGDSSFNDMMTEKDPHFEERMKISTKVMMDEMIDLMTAMEPQIREALAKIYARKYTVRQLAEMNDFFATDTGGAFARDYMMVFVDPEMMQSMMNMMPELMQAMPDIMKKVAAATAHLPAPSKSDKGRDSGAVDPAADAAEAAADAACDAADQCYSEEEAARWADPANWSAEERETVAKLEAEHSATFEKYFKAHEAASENARKRLKKDSE
ncbi:hypothetical protein A8B75_05295 [Sphingomonadales bacterium EhC05]|nr:hypothetical protein A8B75_05295 [Sphingomonadales bacterium EhC05]